MAWIPNSLSPRQAACAFTGIFFFLRIMVMKSAEVHTLPQAMALAIPWSVLLALSFLVLAVDSFRRKPQSDHPWTVALPVCFIAAVFLEPILRLETGIGFWSEKTGQRMMPSEAALMVIVGIAGVWIIGRSQARGLLRILPFVVAVLFLLQQAAASMIHALHWWRSDMLGMIALGVDSLKNGTNPYEGTIRGLPLLYHPGMVVLHAPGFLAGVDLRWMPGLLGALSLALLGRLGKISPGLVIGMAGVFLGPYMFARDDVHVPVLWFVLGLVLWSMKNGHDRFTGLCWGWAIASREWFWILTPFWLLVLWRTRTGIQRNLSLYFAAGMAAVLLIPAYASNPLGLVRSFSFHGPALAARQTEALLVSTVDFGFAWIPVLLDQRYLIWVFQLVCFLAGLGLAWKRLQNLGDFAAWGAITLGAVQFWNPLVEPYHFLLPCYLLLASAALEEGTPEFMEKKETMLPQGHCDI